MTAEHRYPRAVVLLAAVHFAAWLSIVLLKPMAFLLDDAYYSLTVAANIAAGRGITYGGFPTNGFQPLYSFLMTPVFAVVDNRMTALRIALFFGALCSTAALFVLYSLARKITDATSATLAVMLAALSQNLLAHSASGLETPLHALLFLVVVKRYLDVRSGIATKPGVSLGLLLGLLALARFDACFVWIAIALDRFWIHRHQPKKAFIENLVLFIPATVLVLPWFVWCQITFGTVMQSSGAFHHWRGMAQQHVDYALPGFAIFAAVKLISLAIKLPLEPLFGYEQLVRGPARLFLGAEKLHRNFLLQLWEQKPVIAVALVVFGLAVFAALLLFGRGGLSRMRSSAGLLWLWPALFGAALYYPLIQINYSMRHFYAFSVLLSIPVAAFLAGLLRLPNEPAHITDKRKLALLVVLAVLLFRCGPLDPKHPASNPYGFARITEIRAHTPVGARIGYSDSGFYGYFLTKRTVVNLDGILNFDAQEAMKHNQLADYLRQARVDYVLALDNFHNEWKTQFEQALPVLVPPSGDDPDYLYKVKSAGE